MAGSLDSSWAKWNRARFHLEGLTRELTGPVPSVPWSYQYRVTAELQSSGLEYRFYVDPPPFDSERYALIAGDCISNLRSALDHMVYALHERHYRGRVPDKVADVTQFPIFDHARSYRNGGKRGQLIPSCKWNAIGNLSERHRSAIEFLQPYQRWNDKFSRIRGFLSDLATLNNIDKHRRLHVVRVNAFAAPVPWFGAGTVPFAEDDLYGFRYRSFFGPLEGKTEVYRWTFRILPPDIAEQIKRNSEVYACISLNERGEEMTLLPYLKDLVDTVDVVLRRFVIFFR